MVEPGDTVIHDEFGEGTVRKVYEHTVAVEFKVGFTYRDYPQNFTEKNDAEV